jgi:cytochrome c-type biogenesis protein CcmH/NrfG
MKTPALVAVLILVAGTAFPQPAGETPAAREQARLCLERWSELAEHYREGVRLDPEDADVWFRLGSTLLFALNQKVEALAALEEAARLAPADASTRSVLAIVLHALGRYEEAAASFDEALRLDPTILEGRPAAQALREAAHRGEPWP